MRVIKFILSIILSFVLMVGIIGSTVTIYAARILEKDYILATFDEVDLYNQVFKEAQSDFEKYIYQSGLDKDIITSFCSKEKVETDLKAIIDALYSGEKFNVDTTETEVALDRVIEDEINSQKRKISEEEQANIEKFKNAILKSYRNSIGVYTTSTSFIQSDLPKIMDGVNILKNISVTMTVVSAIILLLMNFKNFFTYLNCISISFVSSGTILILIKRLIYSKVEVDNLLILANSLSSVIIKIINSFLSSVNSIGMWLILFGLFGILIISIKNMNRE